MFPLTPALSLGEREKLWRVFGHPVVAVFIQRWNSFSLSHRMGEGRGEGWILLFIIVS
jgi:hypothetical protein